jgi:putative ABC transport system ATP-binding protein
MGEIGVVEGTERVRVVDTLRHGWRTSPELRVGLGGTVALAFVGTAGRIVVPILITLAIDHGLQTGHIRLGYITWLCAVGAVTLLIATVANRMAVVRLAERAEETLYGLRTRAFAHVHALSLADQGEQRRGALVARVTSDIETMSQFFSWGGIAYLLDGALMVAVAAVMFVYDWMLALVALAVAAPLFLVLRAIQRHLVAAYAATRETNADLLSLTSELVSGAAVLRTYDATGAMGERYERAVSTHTRTAIRAGTIGAFLFPSGEVFSVLTIAALVAVGVVRGPASGLTTGALVGFVFLAYRFLEPIAEFTEILDQTQTAVAGWRRVLMLLDTPIEVVDPLDGVELPPGPPSIEVQDVSFAYRARDVGDDLVLALSDVSFRIEPSCAVAIVGATGSGKTTLARLLTRLADPTSGAVRIAGHDLRTVSMSSLRREIVMVPQEPFLFDTTIGENVRFGRRGANQDDVWLAFTELGLDGWVEDLNDGLDTKVGERGEHLSAGERQLVALARAYVANPTCLVLDEATSAVDPATEARLARALESLARGRTSVTIAHRLSTAARADEILVFDHGHLVEQGGHDELVARGGVYAGLWASWIASTGT